MGIREVLSAACGPARSWKLSGCTVFSEVLARALVWQTCACFPPLPPMDPRGGSRSLARPRGRGRGGRPRSPPGSRPRSCQGFPGDLPVYLGRFESAWREPRVEPRGLRRGRTSHLQAPSRMPPKPRSDSESGTYNPEDARQARADGAGGRRLRGREGYRSWPANRWVESAGPGSRKVTSTQEPPSRISMAEARPVTPACTSFSR